MFNLENNDRYQYNRCYDIKSGGYKVRDWVVASARNLCQIYSESLHLCTKCRAPEAYSFPKAVMCSHPHKCTMSTEIVYMVLERSPLYYRTMNIICKRIISRISSCKVVDGDEAAVGRELDFCLAILISSAELESLEFQNELKE